MSKLHFVVLVAIGGLLLCTCMYMAPALAQADEERILSFDSDITVRPNASMEVTETIRVLALGFEIKRGIIRDFPTIYEDAEGNRVEVGFHLQEVRRDGVPEQYEVTWRANGVSIRIGNPDFYLDPGEYTYTIMYTTSRELGFFAGYDELYWNVTGTGWDLRIDNASAVVRLPEGIASTDIKTTAYTGAYGTRGESYTASTSGSLAEFHTTSKLGRYEGLTIVTQWPQGHVRRPTKAELQAYWLYKHLSLFIALIGFFATAIYFFQAWRRVGADPPAGFISPRDSPPNELSPAAVRYITKMGVDTKCFTTALITLAVKGMLHIQCDEKDVYTIAKEDKPAIDVTKTAGSPVVLTQEETMLADALFRSGDSIKAEKDNWQTFSSAQEALRKSLSRQYENVYFKHNYTELGWGIGISVLTLIILIILLFVMQTTLAIASFILALLAFVVLDVLFGQLMPTYTMLGRGVLDGIEGFKLALAGGTDEAGEEHPGSRVLIEQYLPYAVALEVHNEWSRRFERAMAKRAASESGSTQTYIPYMPTWYSYSPGASSRSYMNFEHFTSGFTSSFNSSISSSSSAPGSSSGGGGGGCSGGGGGGGGGGGW